MSTNFRNIEDEIKAFDTKIAYSYPLSDLIEYTTYILKKTPSTRTEKDIEVLKQYSKTSPFLSEVISKVGSHNYHEICLALEYKFLLAGQELPLMERGNQIIFILLKGAVQVEPLLPKTENDPLPINKEKEKSIEITSGVAYGDYDLSENKTQPNNEKIRCTENSHFAILLKKEYSRLAIFAQKEKLENQAAFLSSLPIFKNWPIETLLAWVPIFHQKEIYPRKHIIYKQGDIPTHIHIVRSGNVLCNKKLDMEPEIIGSHEIGLDEQNQVFLMEKEPLKKNVEVSVLGQGQILGEEEALEAYILAKEKENEAKKPIYNIRDFKKENQRDKPCVEVTTVKRETTMIVLSSCAEIWSIPIATFFGNLEAYKPEFFQVALFISKKKRRKDRRIDDLQKYSQKFIHFLKGRKPVILKKDIVSAIKIRKFQQLLNEECQVSPNNSYFYNYQLELSEALTPKTNATPTQKAISVLEDLENERNNSFLTTAKDSPGKSPQKAGFFHQSFYDVVSQLETQVSDITTSWSPKKLRAPTESPLFTDKSPSIKNKVESIINEITNEETREGTEENENSIEGKNKKESPDKMRPSCIATESEVDDRVITEIRSSSLFCIEDSRTSYIKNAVAKKTNIQKMLRKRLPSKPNKKKTLLEGDLGDLSIMRRELELAAPRPINVDKSPYSSDNILGNVSSMVKKVVELRDTKPDPLMKIESKIECGVEGVSLPKSFPPSKSHQDYHSQKNSRKTKREENKVSSLALLEIEDRSKMIVGMGNLSNVLRSEKERNIEKYIIDKDISLRMDRTKQYAPSGVFPGFKPKSLFRKGPDKSVLYMQTLQDEAERRIKRAVGSAKNKSFITDSCFDERNNSAIEFESIVTNAERSVKQISTQGKKRWGSAFTRALVTTES